jgi:DNA-binding Lrp family transcriptional regulator
MDIIDRKIIVQLQHNNRTTYEEMGQLIGYSSMGAKRRVNKLITKGIITLSTTLNTDLLNLHLAFIFLEVKNADAITRLVDRFQNCPRVVNIFRTMGGYNLIALVIAEDQNTLESILIEQCTLRSGNEIRRSEFFPISRIEFTPHLYIRKFLAHKKVLKTPCNVDCSHCPQYKNRQCVGCPSTSHYKGLI